MACHRKSSKSKDVTEEDSILKVSSLGPCLEAKFDELKFEIVHKIEKELVDAQNARDFITHKYDELCNKIQYLTELDATVLGFRTDVKAIEKQISELSMRVDDIEKRTICQEVGSISSSLF